MSTLNSSRGSNSLSVAELRVGSKLTQSIYDDRDVLLLAAGSEVTNLFLENLKRRGIKTVRLHNAKKIKNTRQEAALKASEESSTSESESNLSGAPEKKNQVTSFTDGAVCVLKNNNTNQLDKEINNCQHLGLPPQGPAFSDEFKKRGTEKFDRNNVMQFAANRQKSISDMNMVFENMINGNNMNTKALTTVTDSTLEDLKNDPDLLACLGINPNNGEYPARHSTLTSMLAVAMGAQFKLDRKTLTELSIGCLIHDVGMLKLDRRHYDPEKEITESAWEEITRHPVLVFEMVENLDKIPRTSALVAYQMHERCNGKGYPRKLTAELIHPLAKIAAVADAFVALCSPRNFRKAVQPYKAIEILLQSAKEGYYDPSAIRALLNTVSLFPTGSFVQLNDGRKGRVIRANGSSFDRPIVEIWPGENEPEDPEIVDLLANPELNVEKPILPLDELNRDEEFLMEI